MVMSRVTGHVPPAPFTFVARSKQVQRYSCCRKRRKVETHRRIFACALHGAKASINYRYYRYVSWVIGAARQSDGGAGCHTQINTHQTRWRSPAFIDISLCTRLEIYLECLSVGLSRVVVHTLYRALRNRRHTPLLSAESIPFSGGSIPDGNTYRHCMMFNPKVQSKYL